MNAKKQKQITCSFPDCKEPATHATELKTTNKNNEIIKLPFCKFHLYIVVNGAFSCEYIPKTKDKSEQILLHGPVTSVNLISQVIAAREMVKENKEIVTVKPKMKG